MAYQTKLGIYSACQPPRWSVFLNNCVSTMMWQYASSKMLCWPVSHEKSHASNLIGSSVSWTVKSAKPRNGLKCAGPFPAWGLGAGNETTVVTSCSGTTKTMWLAVIRLRLQSALALVVKKQEQVSCMCTQSSWGNKFVSFPLFTTGFRSCRN